MPCFSFRKNKPASSNKPVPDTIQELIERRHVNVTTNALTSRKEDLVVDDNRVNRDVLRRYLAKHGHSSSEAINGLDALMKLVDNDYEIVWMDIKMPELSGHEATKYLRAEYPDGFGYRGAIVGVTGFADEESREYSIRIGMDNILTKPYVGESIARLHRGLYDRMC